MTHLLSIPELQTYVGVRFDLILCCLPDELFVDFEVLYYGTRFIRKWIQTKPLADLIDEMVTPPGSLHEDNEWIKFVKSVVRVCIIYMHCFVGSNCRVTVV
jgi:hypothetical protein